jgi:hypothetical protein
MTYKIVRYFFKGKKRTTDPESSYIPCGNSSTA